MTSENTLAARVLPIPKLVAARLVAERHYLHRRPPISFAFGMMRGASVVGVMTCGTPPSRHLQLGVCPEEPGLVVELNRLWVDDAEPRNTETWFLSRALRLMPPRIVVSYADTAYGHVGYVYRAANWHYAGWTDMERRTPRLDHFALAPAGEPSLLDEPPRRLHTRDTFRTGTPAVVRRVRRLPKVRYWTTTGNRTERIRLAARCSWPDLSWWDQPPPLPPQPRDEPVDLPGPSCKVTRHPRTCSGEGA